MSGAPGLLQGKLALVTGAGQGNGRAIALGLAAAGARVVVTDVDAGNARQAADDILAAGGQACAHALDVTDPRACEAIAAAVRQAQGPIDVLVNNAAITQKAGFREISEADFDRVLRVNLNEVKSISLSYRGLLKKTSVDIEIYQLTVGAVQSFDPVFSKILFFLPKLL